MLALQWTFRDVDDRLAIALVRELGISRFLARLLLLRGVCDPEEARRFLTPRLTDLHPPFLLADMERACDRILAAIAAGESICVWGDYDVDGVTSSALLGAFFRELKLPLRTFIPDRFRDGYGLSGAPLRALAAEGVSLVITVDCGVSSHAEIALARELGVDVIVVDHHEPPDPLPLAYAIVNPLRKDCPFPFKKMAACGLVFHLLVALRARLREAGYFDATRAEPDLRPLLDLAAIGTVADVVPLVGVNRILTAAGLSVIARAARPGVRALAAVSGTPLEQVRASTIGFQLGPRINAAGRLSHAGKGLELLLADTLDDALAMAREVDEENRKRRDIQERMLAEACDMVEAGGEPGARRALVLWSEQWHPGVSGIVASKIVERYHRPAVLIAVDEGVGKGSARSIPGFHMVEGLAACRDTLTQFGGHAHAAGLGVSADRIAAFAERFERVAADRIDERSLVPTLSVDGEVELGDVTHDLVGEVERLAPFGMGNPRPLFVARGVHVRERRVVGHGHVQLVVERAGFTHRAIAFGMADRAPALHQKVDLAFHPEHNVFRGEARVQLRVRDWRDASTHGGS